MALSLLWQGFDPWPGNFCMAQVQEKKKSSGANLVFKTIKIRNLKDKELCKGKSKANKSKSKK